MSSKIPASIREQFRRNFVALLSLVVALTGFAYNTWRNEQSEENRNHRAVAIELLLELGDFQQLVLRRHYDGDNTISPRLGWGKVLLIRDLALILPEQANMSAGELLDAWQENVDLIGHDKAATNQLLQAVDLLRDEVITLIRELK